ncbi:AbrB family transcriptional regulator [Pseudodesulfovibrio sp. F-1]|uniref:AbrB family transcriptional regulator n=2 Tax=Pseudodesulfovibrio alkaliphilus TaxID=2661613 RepID=A0A7K1KPG1_9BACT|nr:AbrB family transcriptional regulator [Pseudodesulfovibrio alkaliphilus]
MISFRLLGKWTSLVLISAALAALLRLGGLPAAELLGPMIAGMFFALRGVVLHVPRSVFSGAQAVVGCMVALTLTPSILTSLGRDWPIMVVVVCMTIAAGGVVGFLLMRLGSLPGNTAAWGMSPGGAAAMTAMAESFGADVRMVAFMQYLRMFVVVLTASGVSRILLGHAADLPGAYSWSPDFDAPLVPLLQTLALVAGGVLLSGRLRIPAAAMLLPMLAGAALNSMGIVTLVLPHWLLWTAYASLGWYVGMRFDRETVLHVLRTIPQMLLATFLLIGLCCVSAWLLTVWPGLDPLSAYLATSPGGLDSVAIIAMGSGCDVGFILALQTLRLFAVVAAGPFVARLVCRISGVSARGSGIAP